MGVSISEGTKTDLDAIVAGGDAFLARIKQFQDSKADYEAAVANLNIGKDVAAALAEAQTREAAALQTIADAKDEAAKLIADAEAHAATVVSQAQADVAALTSAAQAKADALSHELKNAQDVLTAWSEKTTADANQIMAAATAAQKQVDKQVATNKQVADDLAAAMKAAQTATAGAESTRVTLQAKLDAIKAAAS